MAEESEKEADKPAEAAPPKKGGMGKVLLIVGAIVLILAGVGIPVTLLMLKKTAPTEEVEADAAHQPEGHGLTEEGAAEESELQEGEEPLGGMLPFDTFVVNLKDGRYLRVQMQFEFVERDIPKKVYPRIVPIRDAVLALLASRSAAEVLSSQGRDALKRDIRDLVNESLRKEDVKNVFFSQFVVQ